MKNIGIIIDCLQGGGAERCVADLSVYLDRHGYNIIIFTDLSVDVKYDYCGVLVDFPFSLGETEDKACINLLDRKVSELKVLKEKYNIDICISFMQFYNYINILSKGNEHVILTTHSVNSIYAKYERSDFWSVRTFSTLYQYADMITFPSEYCRRDWIEHYGDKNNITKIMYNPVHVMNTEGDGDKDNIIVAVGRLHPVKRQWHLIRAFKRVRQACPDSRLIILGDGELRESLEELIIKLDLADSVELMGNVDNVEVYLNKAKVLAMCSRCEAMPCSVLEAFSAGVPAVSCDSPGGIREEIGISLDVDVSKAPLIGDCGIITPYIKETASDELSKNEKIFADEIVRLLKDEKLRNRLSVNARNKAENFLPEVICAGWVEEIIEKKYDREIDYEGFEKLKSKCIDEFTSKKALNNDLYVSYYRLLEKWMTLREKGKTLKPYFEARGIKNIIIYGLGKNANHLIRDLENTDVKIICAIDYKAINKYNDFPILTMEDELPQADCIVVTPIYEMEAIRTQLGGKTTMPVVSLEEVVRVCLNE